MILGNRNEGWRRVTRVAVGLALLLPASGCITPNASWLGGGETLMPQYRTTSHEVDYRTLGLTTPPMGLRWYRVDRSYVLANRTTGLIIKSVPVPVS